MEVEEALKDLGEDGLILTWLNEHLAFKNKYENKYICF